MSRCLMCPEHPEFSNDELLVHLRDDHGYIDGLAVPPAAERSARKRIAALAFWVTAAAVASVVIVAYLGVLVRVFNLFA